MFTNLIIWTHYRHYIKCNYVTLVGIPQFGRLGDPERCHNQLNYIRLDDITMHTLYYTGILPQIFHHLLDHMFAPCINNSVYTTLPHIVL